jgi:hypothetical protein
MTTSKMLAASVAILGLTSFAAQAQNSTTPFAAPSEVAPVVGLADLGNHIAARVLNMNGYNITNLGDPFFEGDAVTLGYFQRNIGWDHIGKKDVDMGGFSLGNISKITLNEGTVLGGVFDAPAITHPKITGGVVSGISLKNSSIEVPMVTGGTFKSPALIGPTIDRASLTGGDISNAEVSGGSITGSEILESKFSDGLIENAKIMGDTTVEGSLDLSGAEITGSLSGNLDMGDNRITSVGDATDDTDAMNMRSTRTLIEEEVADLTAVLEGMRSAIENGDPVDVVTVIEKPVTITMADPVVVPSPLDIEEVSRKLRSVSGDFMVSGSLTASGSLNGVTSQFRPTPSAADSLGRITGSDAMDSLRKIHSVVYNLPEGGLAIGIDPMTIPQEMEFVKRAATTDDTFESVDYAQMIGPMLAAIQNMDGRIEELERRLSADR